MEKITFEYVNPIDYPEYYNGENPTVSPIQVPDEHWKTVERMGGGIRDQYNGLLKLIAQGELVRNVHMYVADDPIPKWHEVTL